MRSFFGVRRRLKEVRPYAHRLGTESRAAHDGPAKLEESLHEDGGKGEVVGLVVVAVLGPQILWKGPNSGEPGLDQSGLAEGTAADCQRIRHPLLDCLGEIARAVPHHSLRKRKC